MTGWGHSCRTVVEHVERARASLAGDAPPVSLAVVAVRADTRGRRRPDDEGMRRRGVAKDPQATVAADLVA
jgi:hypothetical protein